MKIAVIAVVLAVAVAAGAAAGLMPRPVPLYAASPARAHVVLGPVAVVSEARPDARGWTAHHAVPLVAASRARYGRRPDALIGVAHEVLPNGVGARSTALAVIWRD